MASLTHSTTTLLLLGLCGFGLLGLCHGQAIPAPAPVQSAFVGVLTTTAPNITVEAPCEGPSNARLIINDVTPVPREGQQPKITIRNVGGKVANLTGYTLAGTNTNKDDPTAKVLRIPPTRQCTENATVNPGGTLVFFPKTDQNPCGFEFPLNATGSVQLSDQSGNRVAAVGWQNATPGSEVLLMPDGSYKTVPTATLNVVQVLSALGNYDTLVAALKATGLDQQLNGASDPQYQGPVLAGPAVQITPQFPWWFAGASMPPPPPPPPAPEQSHAVGIPALGPYTLFAPTDDAFDTLLVNLGGGRRLPLESLYRLPQLKDILMYHVVTGLYTSEYLRNNTPLYTAKGVELVPILDGCQTNGKLMIHDSCIDKPTPDNYTCADQVRFDKCYFPFMTSALAAQWQGGFCQRTCSRCSCAPDSGVICAEVVEVNALTSNGVVHGISRVLFPPPLFTKEAAIAQAAAANASGTANATLPLGLAPPVGVAVTGGMPSVMPGAVPPLGAAVAPAPGLPPPIPVPAAGAPATTLAPMQGAAATTGAPAAGGPGGFTGALTGGASPAPGGPSSSPSPSSPSPSSPSPSPSSPSSPSPAAGKRRLWK